MTIGDKPVSISEFFYSAEKNGENDESVLSILNQIASQIQAADIIEDFYQLPLTLIFKILEKVDFSQIPDAANVLKTIVSKTALSIYIISQIDYQGRNCSSHAAHWLHDNDDSYPYICWAGNIETLEQAKSVASLWAECTARYIRSRQSFDDIADQLKDQFGWEDDYYYTDLRR